MRTAVIVIVVVVVVAVVALAWPEKGWACGLAPHVGPTGLIQECDGRRSDAVGPWRLALQGGALRSELHTAGPRIAIEQVSITARGEYRLGTRLVFGLGAGSILGGSLRFSGAASSNIGVGWTAGASVAALAVAEETVRPFLLAMASFAYSVVRVDSGPGAADARFIGRDVRLGLAVGKSFGVARPYLGARVFTGGFRWEASSPATTGGDVHQYQAGAGVALDLPRQFDLVVELMPLGEQSLTVGVGLSI